MAATRVARRGSGAAALARLAAAVAWGCCLLPQAVQGAPLTDGRNYVAANCSDLAATFLDINNIVAAGAAASYKFTITLPCYAGSNKLGSWGRPYYSCFDVAQFQPIMPILAVNKPTTVTIVADKTTCLKSPEPARPTLLAGVNEYWAAPMLLFGTANASAATANVLKVSMTNVDIDAGGYRPGIRAGNLASLALVSVNIWNATDNDNPAALEVLDTPTTFKCTKTAPCTVSGAATTAVNGLEGYPSAGGALLIVAITKGAPFLASYVNFAYNQHSNYGGVFFVLKQFSGPLSVKFASCSFKSNTASVCSVGVTGRVDPNAAGTGGEPLALDFTGTTWSGNTATTSNTQARVALVCGLYAKGIPWPAAKVTKITGLPGAVGAAGTVHQLSPTILAAISSLLSASLPSTLSAEFLVVDETSPAH